MYYAPVSISRIEIGASLISIKKEQRMTLRGDALRSQASRHMKRIALLPTLSAHTNVWGIGAIMFELLTHEAVVNYLDKDEWTVNEAFRDIPNSRTPEYSGALTELIKLCLKPEPWDRPSIEELEIKIKTMCQSIVNEYATNPSQREQDRLYYKGSEINQMPPGNWNYWSPLMEYVPRPSEAPDRVRDPKNPFTDTIVYPPFPTSELDGLEEEGEEEYDRSGDENDDKHSDDGDEGQDDESDDALSSPNGSDADHPIIVSSTGNDADHPVVVSSTGNDADNPVIVSDAGDDADPPVVVFDSSESRGSHGSHGSDGSEDNRSSEGGSNSSVSSDNSETRRRMAIKTLPGA